MNPRPTDARTVLLNASSSSGLYLIVVSSMVLLLGIVVEPLSRVAKRAADSLF